MLSGFSGIRTLNLDDKDLLSGFSGIRTHNLDDKDLLLALEKPILPLSYLGLLM